MSHSNAKIVSTQLTLLIHKKEMRNWKIDKHIYISFAYLSCKCLNTKRMVSGIAHIERENKLNAWKIKKKTEKQTK